MFAWLDGFLQDLRLAARSLRRDAALAWAIVFILAISIGANTAIFSALNAVLLRPLPYSQPDRLVRIWESNAERGIVETAVSPLNFQDWRREQKVFVEMAASEMATFNITGEGDPERVSAAKITANMLPMLGVMPAVGRGFRQEEELFGNHAVVLLSYGLWQSRFAGDKSVVNRAINLNGVSHVIIGVMPSEFRFPTLRDIWLPLVLDPVREPWRADRSNRNIAVYGRLKHDATLAQASAEMDLITRGLQQRYPSSNMGWRARVRSFPDWIVPAETRQSIAVLFGAVALVLLLASANVANLLLARSVARSREAAIRIALGASGRRVVQQWVTEAVLLAGLGGFCGLLLSMWATNLLGDSSAQTIPRINESRIDATVLVFNLFVSVLTGVGCGLIPAWRVSRSAPFERIKEGSRGTEGRATNRIGAALVVTQISLALGVLIIAGLMIRTFVRMQSIPLGFVPDNVLTFQMSLPESKYRREGRVQFYEQLLERLNRSAGVVSAAATTHSPSGSEWKLEISRLGADKGSNRVVLSADARAITPGYFRTLGIPLVRGRDFTWQDRTSRPLNLIVSETFAKRCWPNEDPVGKAFQPGGGSSPGVVVGVVGDVRSGTQEVAQPAFYFPYAYIGMQSVMVVARTNGNSEQMAADVRAEVRGLDSEQPIYNIRTMENILSGLISQPRIRTIFITVFGVTALLLAGFGVYSMMSYRVRTRTREIGVRIALGASSHEILRTVCGQALKHVVVGVALGLIVALAFTRLIKSLLFNVSATDPVVFIFVTAILIAVALLASYVPARRTMNVDPAMVLRDE